MHRCKNSNSQLTDEPKTVWERYDSDRMTDQEREYLRGLRDALADTNARIVQMRLNAADIGVLQLTEGVSSDFQHRCSFEK